MSHMRGIFVAQGLAFQRVDAIDADALSNSFVRKIAVPTTGKHARNLTPSEVACYLSHKKAWETALAQKLDYAAIFEDDIHLAPDAGKILSCAETWIPAGADLIKLETLCMPAHVGRGGAVIACTQHRLERLLGSHYGAAGYIVSRRAMEILCAESRILPLPVDDVIFGAHYRVFGQLKAFQVDPAICIQDQYLDGAEAGRLGIVSQIHDRHVQTPLPPDNSGPIKRAAIRLKTKLDRRHRKIRIALLQSLGRAEQKTVGFGRNKD